MIFIVRNLNCLKEGQTASWTQTLTRLSKIVISLDLDVLLYEFKVSIDVMATKSDKIGSKKVKGQVHDSGSAVSDKLHIKATNL